MDQHQERRRGQFHRSRRGPDRRGPDRRTPPPQGQQGGRDQGGRDQGGREQGGREQVDVEQIMRDIRARIAQRHGVELSNQQIQELAARRLESILDPRTMKPALLDQLRRSAGERPPARAARVEAPYAFDDTTLYESHRGLLRWTRRLLNPLLKLFFNPNPLIRALNVQARLNLEAAERDAERERRQTEWNALQYEIVQRLVTEVSKVSLELQAQSMRIESLAAKVDFNERRVRGIEGTMHQPRPGRPLESSIAAAAVVPEPAAAESLVEVGQGDVAKRRRRRRRGRRSGAAAGEPPGMGSQGPPDAGASEADGIEADSEEVEALESGAIGTATGAPTSLGEGESDLLNQVGAGTSVEAPLTSEGESLGPPEPHGTAVDNVGAPPPEAARADEDRPAAPSEPPDAFPDPDRDRRQQ